jgi:hypothetical protein
LVHLDRLDAITEVDRPLPELTPPAVSDVQQLSQEDLHKAVLTGPMRVRWKKGVSYPGLGIIAKLATSRLAVAPISRTSIGLVI